MNAMDDRSERRGAAFFDLDRTLIQGSSTVKWALAAWRAGMLPGPPMLSALVNGIAFRITGGSDEQSRKAVETSLELVAGAEQSTMLELSDELVPKLVSKVRPESNNLLEMHKEAGRDRYIISASPIEIVGALADHLGLEGAIGTEAEVADDGRYTGGLSSAWIYGPAKAAAINKLVAEKGYDLRLCYSYSDSSSDLPMLEMVGHPVVVNPDSDLHKIARTRGWPVVEFRSRATEVTKYGVLGAAAGGGMVASYYLGRRRERGSSRPRLRR